MGKELHPSIQEFKGFVKKHPKLVQEVRAGRKTWQELYEDWYLLGEEDDQWNQYKEQNEKMQETSSNDSTSDFITKAFSTIKNVKIENVQEHISNIGTAISTIQSVIHQFQTSKKNNNSDSHHHHHPFAFRKD